MKSPTLIDLFCGAGGISHGFSKAGFSVLAGVDHDADAVVTFKRNHPLSQGLKADLDKISPQDLGDALGIQPGQVDCLAGGPPCQGFSRNRAFRHKDGAFVDDARNHLYWYFFEFVAYFRPKVVIMENVPEILIKANGAFSEAVFERFRNLGYAANARVLNAAEYGVPQWRRRAIFLAGSDNQAIPFPPAITQPGLRAGRRTPNSSKYIGNGFGTYSMLPLLGVTSPNVWEAISDLHGVYAPTIDGSCSYATEPASTYQEERRAGLMRVANHYPWQLSQRQLARMQLLGQGEGHLHLPEHLRVKEGYGSAYRRMQADAQALTLTTWMFHPGSGMFTHPYDDRVITIREAARLQSFQDDFVFTGKYHSQCRQLGNAVAPLLAKQLARTVATALEYRTPTEVLPEHATSEL